VLVPDFWAESRQQHRSGKMQITVRRYGWSMTSDADALKMAESRATEALRRILAGEKLERRERKSAYNGASGAPIREEVLARHGDEVITRNSYGAHCLNTPRALFADVDFDLGVRSPTLLVAFAILAAFAIVAASYFRNWGLAPVLLLLALLFTWPLAKLLQSITAASQGGPERIAKRRIARFLARNPSWSLRLYQTPRGYRLLVTHQPFNANAPEVERFFSAVDADPVYRRMCKNQQCFRARLTAKPWRIGIAAHMRPRPGIWPIAAEQLQKRQRWIAEYERAAASVAACRFVEVLGSGTVHRDIKAVVELHDRATRANEISLAVA
jgi:hypothetical protein